MKHGRKCNGRLEGWNERRKDNEFLWLWSAWKVNFKLGDNICLCHYNHYLIQSLLSCGLWRQRSRTLWLRHRGRRSTWSCEKNRKVLRQINFFIPQKTYCGCATVIWMLVKASKRSVWIFELRGNCLYCECRDGGSDGTEDYDMRVFPAKCWYRSTFRDFRLPPTQKV